MSIVVRVVCEICGNDVVRSACCCPYCGSKMGTGGAAVKVFQHRMLNLEEGRPVVEAALNRMERGIADFSRQGITALTLIHGYGSSGRGGVIRKECRKLLEYMVATDSIAGYVPGEEFSSHHTAARQWLRRYPMLSDNSHWNRGNRGITLVFL